MSKHAHWGNHLNLADRFASGSSAGAGEASGSIMCFLFTSPLVLSCKPNCVRENEVPLQVTEHKRNSSVNKDEV